MQQEKKRRKKSLHDENAHVGLIHLTSPSASCLAADPSQFVFGNAQKELLLHYFGLSSALPACSLDMLVFLSFYICTWMMNFCGQPHKKKAIQVGVGLMISAAGSGKSYLPDTIRVLSHGTGTLT